MDSTSKVQQTAALSQVAADIFQRRRIAGLALVDQAETIALACYSMAQRFHQGGKLIAFGNGGSSTDAQHIAVEFVHPVMVGKRALPAISLTNDIATLTSLAYRHGWHDVFAYQLRCLAHPQDIAIAISQDKPSQNVLRGLEVAKQMGLLTIALAGGHSDTMAARSMADHILAAPAEEPQIVKELQVSIYHILWELVHVFFAQPGLLGPQEGP
jgi:D-sedoheptulose 7-phosphate isomerase